MYLPVLRVSQLAFALVAMVGGFLIAASPAHALVSPRPATTPSFNGTVWATAYAGNTIFVGGDFTAAQVGGRLMPRSRLAAINASTGALLNWAPSANGQVRAIAVVGQAVYVGGLFSAINGVARDSLARLDASSGRLHGTFLHTVSGNPYAFAVGAGRLYVGGSIKAVDGQRRTELAAFSLATGALDAKWRPSADDQVQALQAISGRVYIGGKFHAINGKKGTWRLAAVDTSAGKVIGGFKAEAKYITYDIAVSGSRVYAAHGGQGGRVIAYDLSGGRRWMLTLDGDVRTVAALNGTVYAGGHFDNVCRSARTAAQGRCIDGNVARIKLVAMDGNGRVRPWKADANGVAGVLTSAVDVRTDRLAVGGAFTTLNGAAQKRFAQFN